jgi:CDP-diacylglycerol--serine O-phosphatidyltransferase
MNLHLKAHYESLMGHKTRSSARRCIPHLFTLGNALCGYVSIIQSLEGHYTIAAYAIILAAIMDFLDGRIARALGVTSCIGMELDSLSDAISFCLAPTIMLYGSQAPTNTSLLLVALGIYLCAGLWRLARFNATSIEQCYAFKGLPTTIAAFCMAAIIMAEPWFELHLQDHLFYGALLVTVIFLSYLMISAIPFPTFKNISYKKIKWGILIISTMVPFLLWYSYKGYPCLFIAISAYIVSGIFYRFLVPSC